MLKHRDQWTGETILILGLYLACVRATLARAATVLDCGEFDCAEMPATFSEEVSDLLSCMRLAAYRLKTLHHPRGQQINKAVLRLDTDFHEVGCLTKQCMDDAGALLGD